MFIRLRVRVIGMVLAILFLRGVGVVGHRKGEAHDASEKSAQSGPEAVRFPSSSSRLRDPAEGTGLTDLIPL